MLSLSDANQSEVIEAFNSSSHFWIYIYQYWMVLSRLKFMINEMILI